MFVLLTVMTLFLSVQFTVYGSRVHVCISVYV